MVEKKTNPQSETSSAKKRSAAPSRKTRKPVTIDLEATKIKSASTSKAEANKSPKQAPGRKPGSVPPVSKSAPSRSSAQPGNAETKKAPVSGTGNPQKPDITPNRAAESHTKPKPTATKSGANGRGSVALITAGIIGGAVALLLAFILQQFGMLSAEPSNDPSLKASIEKLTNDIAVLSSRPQAEPLPDMAPIIARVEKLESTDNRDQNGAGEAVAINQKHISDLGKTISGLEETTARLENSISVGAAGENAGLSAIAKRVTAVEQMAKTGERNLVVVEALETRLDVLSKNVAAMPNPTSSNLEAAMAKLAKDIQQMKHNTGEGLSSTNRQLARLDGTLAEIGARMDELSSRIGALESIASTPQKDEQKVARAMALANLKASIDNGGSFVEALVLYENLSVDQNLTEPLKKFAQSGIPSLAAINGSFLKVSDKIIATVAIKKDTGLAGKFLFNARSLVKVKTLGAVKGDGVAAINSRIEAALNRGNLASAINEWDALPETAKAASTDWIKLAKARHQANTMIAGLLKQFITGLSGNNN